MDRRPRGRPGVAGALAALALACATSRAGQPYLETSADGRERLEGVELGSVGSAASPSQGYPWVPLIVLCRKTEAGRDAGSVLLATIVLPAERFGFEQLVATGPAGERILPGRVIQSDGRFGLYDPRYTEKIEVALSDDDVAFLAAAGPALELRMEGARLWIKVPPGPALADAVRAHRAANAPRARGSAPAAPD